MSTLFEKLKLDNIGIGNIQSVDEMSIIPIIGESSNSIADPSNVSFIRTTTYGTMQFKNDDVKPAIIPTNYMVRGSGAQDHAMSEVGIIEPKTNKNFDNACCIEETQGGFLSSKNNEEDVLPVQLRKVLLDESSRGRSQYSKLWEDIRNWLKGVVSSRSAHLRYFYDNADIKASLEDFAAEFEPVEGQIGAIILFYDTLVGIEIMPSSNYWNAYWKQLIRGCYGAELIRAKKLNLLTSSSMKLPEIPDGSTPDDIKGIIDQHMNNIRQEVIPILTNIEIQKYFKTGTSSGLEMRLLLTENGGGDIILENGTPIYLSIVL